MSSFMSRVRRSITLADLVTPLKDDLFRAQKDNVFSFQATSPDFARITVDTLFICEICPNMHDAKIAMKASQKLGIIDPVTGQPDTSKINRKMLGSMPAISVLKQRQIVCLLFFWEEEIVRWRLLVDKEREIRERAATAGLSDSDRVEIEHVLKVLEAEKQVLPSARDENGRLLVNTEEEQLPVYSEPQSVRT